IGSDRYAMSDTIGIRNPWECHHRFLPLALPPEANFFHRNFNNMTATDYGPVIRQLQGFDADHSSQDFLIVGDIESHRYVLIGAVTARRSLTYLYLHCRQTRVVGVSYYQPDIAPDGEPEMMVRLDGEDWRSLLIEYARQAAEYADVLPIAAEKNVLGYCSWYYYHQSITCDQFFENVQALVEARCDFPAQIAQVDDGYQAHHGDWLTSNSRWPVSLAEVAARIRRHGMRAGIWLMPLLASTSSELFGRHPEWFVKDGEGQPWLVRGWSPPPEHHWACLDATRNEVLEHLRHVFITLHEWGFDYFKMDGLGFMMPSGRRDDPQATGVSAYRLALETIRRAVPSATLLGCCPPYLASLGLIDHARVSADTAACWIKHRHVDGISYEEDNAPPDPESPCLSNALHQALARWWMMDRWFRADPDVVLVRENSSRLTEGEARLSALAGILTGVIITSDHFGHMNQERLSLLRRIAPLRLRDPRPIAWRPGYWPQAFEGILQGRRAVAIFNDLPRPQDWRLCDWQFDDGVDELLHPMGALRDVITVPPHDAALFVERQKAMK
ncbi:MAG TPA: alpha-galactosidase, partial [Candidatus Hydrogenedentes bacterium]|nr:alpha-galactosidase [Candidatus Hydrogenedentota bacterium]